MKTIGKATETAREIYERIPMKQSIITLPKMSNSTSSDVTSGDT